MTNTKNKLPEQYRGILYGCILFASILLIAGCYSSPSQIKPTEWAGQLDIAYPPERFIAQIGFGNDRENAMTNALAAISRYFTSEVSSSTNLSEKYSQTNGGAITELFVSDEIFVNSETQLFMVQFDENIWINPSTKETGILALINRDNAWAIYEPRLRSKIEPFMRVFQEAAKYSDPIRRYLIYQNAMSNIAEDMQDALTFAHILHPSEAEKYDIVQTSLDAVLYHAQEALDKITLLVKCSDDSNNLIQNSINRVLSSHGIKLVNDEVLSSNWCDAKIFQNREDLLAGTFFKPAVDISIYGAGGVLFSCNMLVQERRGARDPDIAKRRAYEELSKVIEDSLWDKFIQKE
jgi:hypothetical protein